MDEIEFNKDLADINKGGGFSRLAKMTAHLTGRPLTFIAATATIVVWGATGPIFHYSDTWQLVINTGTTIITFLMVFLIQNTQNRDSLAVQLKLDELIRATKGAHTAMMALEELTDKELELIQKQYLALAEKGRHDLRQGRSDQGTPSVTAQFGNPRDRS